MAKKRLNAALTSRVNAIVARHAGQAAIGARFTAHEAGRKPGYAFKNATDEEADIFVYDEISSWWGIGANDFVRDLNELDAKTINLYINSPGGSVFEGYAIYSALLRYSEKHGATINVVVDGWAASIASVIAMAGDTIKIGAHASIMIHEPSSMVWGTAEEMREEADVLDQIEESIVDIYVARTGGDRKEIVDWVKAEKWFKGQEAVDSGFADEVIPLKTKKTDDDEEDVAKGRPVASAPADFYTQIFPNLPDDVRTALESGGEQTTNLPKTTREFRDFLRASGFSGKQADLIAGNGFKPKAEARDEPAIEPEKPTTTDLRDGAEKREITLAAIKRATAIAAVRAASLSTI